MASLVVYVSDLELNAYRRGRASGYRQAMRDAWSARRQGLSREETESYMRAKIDRFPKPVAVAVHDAG